MFETSGELKIMDTTNTQSPGAVKSSGESIPFKIARSRDWLDALRISPQARRLSRLSGRDFLVTIQRILGHDLELRHGVYFEKSR